MASLQGKPDGSSSSEAKPILKHLGHLNYHLTCVCWCINDPLRPIRGWATV